MYRTVTHTICFEHRPSASATVRLPAEAAHTEDKVVTDAVFHAPMFALKADADWNICEPTATGTTAASSAYTHPLERIRARPRTHERARMHARLGAYVPHVHLGGTPTYDDMCTAQGYVYV